jgi:AmmeMemoRadiSam system protein B
MLSTVDRVSVSSVPRAVRGESTREPAVAGSFYPADVSEMNQSLDKMLAAKVVAVPCHACMVPHAGWRFSGQLAADVLQRIKFPSRIIAIGPKHTPHGLNWAVAPHHSWSIPGGSVESDYELAKKLSDAIPGLEMDAAAHQKEHGIEVELPIIARLAPETKVVGITLSGGSLERCEEFAEGLAKVVAEMDEKPLLLISSDMNHFANDQETRRLDQIALADLDRLDPDALFETVTTNHISMCGVLPAVVILKALKRLNLLRQSIQVGYSTSADVTGDTNRVVGYAGRIFN